MEGSAVSLLVLTQTLKPHGFNIEGTHSGERLHLVMHRYLLAVFYCLAVFTAAAQQQSFPQHLFFRVTLGPQFSSPASGRLLLFVSPGHGDKAVDSDMMMPNKTYVAAKEVPYLAPGQTISVDADDLVFPGPLSNARSGDYEAQAVLDVGHTYNYSGRTPGDLESEVAALPAWNPQQQVPPALTITMTVPEPPDPLSNAPDLLSALEPVDFRSPVLSRFWGRDIRMKAWVLSPPAIARIRGNTIPRFTSPTALATHWPPCQPLRAVTLSTHAKRQNAADDMGAARSEQPYRHPRICRRRKQRSLGYGAHHGTDSLPGSPLPHGCPRRRTVSARPLLRWLGNAVAANGVPEDLWWYMVHLSGPQ